LHQHHSHSLQSGESGASEAWPHLTAPSYANDVAHTQQQQQQQQHQQAQQQLQPAGSPNSNSNGAYGCAPLYDGAPYEVALGYGGAVVASAGGATSSDKEYLYGGYIFMGEMGWGLELGVGTLMGTQNYTHGEISQVNSKVEKNKRWHRVCGLVPKCEI